MDKGQFAKIAAAIDGYNTWKIFQNKQIMEQWYMELRDLPYEITQAAVRRIVRNDEKMTIGKIRRTVKDILWDNVDPKQEGLYDRLLTLDKLEKEDQQIGKELFVGEWPNDYLGLDPPEP